MATILPQNHVYVLIFLSFCTRNNEVCSAAKGRVDPLPARAAAAVSAADPTFRPKYPTSNRSKSQRAPFMSKIIRIFLIFFH